MGYCGGKVGSLTGMGVEGGCVEDGVEGKVLRSAEGGVDEEEE